MQQQGHRNVTRHRMPDSPPVNLCFHGIGAPQRELEEGEAKYWVTADFFEEVVALAAGRPQVALSFDDGNASDVQRALPALVRRGVVARFFPLAGRIGSPGSLGEADLRELVSHGMEVGTHGWSHRPLTGLGHADLYREIVDARRVTALAAGAPVASLALPLGRYDRRVLAALRRHGYLRVFSSDRARVSDRRWLQPRYSLTGDDHIDDVVRLVDSRSRVAARLLDSVRITVKGIR